MPTPIPPPPVRYFECYNDSTATVIYPAIFDDDGVLIWDGKTAGGMDIDGGKSHVLYTPAYYNDKPCPGGHKTINMSLINPSPTDMTVIKLGCSIKDVATLQYDNVNPRTFSTASQNTAVGHKDGEGAAGGFTVDPAAQRLAITHLQEAYPQFDNTVAVAKLLGAVAQVIAPGATV